MSQPRVSYGEFLLRRLHSLSGLVPLTFFMFFHFFANAYSTLGREPFNKIVDQLRGLPFLMGIEWAFIFSPFLFHMFYGLWVVYSGKPNPLRQDYRRNWAYLLQRISAAIVFAFVLYHVIGLHFLDPATDHETGETDFFTYLHYRLQNPYVYWWYVIGVGATVFHLANGICTFCMTWGITIGRTSQRYTAYAMTTLGAAVFALGIGALNGFLDVQEKVAPTPKGPVETSFLGQRCPPEHRGGEASRGIAAHRDLACGGGAQVLQ